MLVIVVLFLFIMWLVALASSDSDPAADFIFGIKSVLKYLLVLPLVIVNKVRRRK